MNLRNDIRYIENWDINDVRRLIYYSRYGAWVKAGDDLLRVSINNLIKTIEHPVEGGVRYGQEIKPINKAAENQWKLLLAKHAKEILISGANSSSGREYKTLAGLKLETAYYNFFHINFELENGRYIDLDITIENFASYQSGTMRIEGERPKVSADNTIIEDAIKNELWLAVTSGDVEEVKAFLDANADFDLYSTYQGNSLIEAMFKTTPELNLPLIASQSDYKGMLETLMEHGFDFNYPIPSLEGKTSIDICNNYTSTQQNLWFFQKYNPTHLLLINEINQLLGRENPITQKSGCAII